MRIYFFSIDHFRDIPVDSQTTDILHSVFFFHYDVTIKALKMLQSTAIIYDVIMTKRQSALCP